MRDVQKAVFDNSAGTGILQEKRPSVAYELPGVQAKEAVVVAQ